MDTPMQRVGGMVGTSFAAAVTLGGANFVAVRISNRELDPFWGAGIRFTLAAAIFVVVCIYLRLRVPRGRQLAQTILYGLLGFASFYALMYWALLQVTAGVATVVLALVPLVTMLLAAAQRLERLRLPAIIGSALALCGIVWMVISPAQLVLPLGALGAMLGAAVCAGQGVIVGKKVADNHPAMTNAVGMVTGSIVLFAMSALVGETWAFPRQPEVLWSLAYLVTLGSAGLFVLLMFVVRRWTASATSYMFVLFPVVTLLLDVLINREPLKVNAVIGAALVMTGVWFGALSPRARVKPSSATEASLSPALESG